MVNYVLTDNSSGNNLLNDPLNWNAGLDGFPGDGVGKNPEADKIICDGTWPLGDLDINVATRVGEIHIDAGYSGTITQGANVTVDDAGAHTGDFIQEDGVWDENGYDLNVDNDFNRTGGVFVGNGQFFLTGDGNHTLNGDTTFDDFKNDPALTNTLTFEANKTFRVNGQLDLMGVVAGTINCVSSAPGTRYKLTHDGTKGTIIRNTITDMDYGDSKLNLKPLNPDTGVDGGNTVSVFGMKSLIVSADNHAGVKTAIETVDDSKYLKTVIKDGVAVIYYKRT